MLTSHEYIRHLTHSSRNYKPTTEIDAPRTGRHSPAETGLLPRIQLETLPFHHFSGTLRAPYYAGYRDISSTNNQPGAVRSNLRAPSLLGTYIR